MTIAGRRVTRLAAAFMLASAWVAPGAAAVVPPAVDDALLPPAGTPAPRVSTEQSEPCRTAPAAGSSRVRQMSAAELQAVWRLTRGAGQTVAVIDTGVARHRLLPHLLPGGDYVSDGDGMQDCDGHGTIVAGIIGAAHVEQDGVAFGGGAFGGGAFGGGAFGGVAPDAGIVAIRQSSNVFRQAGSASGSGVGDVDTLAMAVRNAADLGATVINISSVACLAAADALDDRSLGAALAYAVDVKNVVVVTAAGNVGGAGQCPEQNPPPDPVHPGRPNWDAVTVVASPAWYDEYVLTVGSVGPDGRASTFSLAGPWVDVSAPGEAVVSLGLDGEGLIDTMPGSARAETISGTSYSAPVVAGIAALVRARSPRLTARQVMQRIEDTAHHPAAGWDPWVGHGVVDALAAVSTDGAAEPTTQPASPGAPARADTPRSDSRPRGVAFVGAAICIIAATVAMTASAGWLRRRRDPVAED